MSEPALKCENNAIFKQVYILTLFIAFKIAYSCCLSLGENLDFTEFLQKKFYISTYLYLFTPKRAPCIKGLFRPAAMSRF